MSLMWQYIAIGSLLGLAVAYLVVHYVRKRRKAGCQRCAIYKAVNKQPEPYNPKTADRQVSKH